jgi:cytochrome o ubiquinol oxidase subunit 1
MPGYVLGLMGVTRRTSRFDDPSLQIWFQISAFGTVLVAIGIAALLMQLYISFRRREQLRDRTGDPWNGRTLEWSTSSPPPPYNFAFTPMIHDTDAWHDMKRSRYQRPSQGFIRIHMPMNTGAGVVLAGLSTLCAFALVWHMWPLAVMAFVATLAVAVAHTFNYDRDFYLDPSEVARVEAARARLEAGPA